jgi:hypothetical protein
MEARAARAIDFRVRDIFRRLLWRTQERTQRKSAFSAFFLNVLCFVPPNSSERVPPTHPQSLRPRPPAKSTMNRRVSPYANSQARSSVLVMGVVSVVLLWAMLFFYSRPNRFVNRFKKEGFVDCTVYTSLGHTNVISYFSRLSHFRRCAWSVF